MHTQPSVAAAADDDDDDDTDAITIALSVVCFSSNSITIVTGYDSNRMDRRTDGWTDIVCVRSQIDAQRHIHRIKYKPCCNVL